MKINKNKILKMNSLSLELVKKIEKDSIRIEIFITKIKIITLRRITKRRITIRRITEI